MSDKCMPVFYLPHGGGPLPLLDDPSHQSLVHNLNSMQPRLGDPAAILLISAHWESMTAQVISAADPELIYDYYGFPPESYEIQYPAKGYPQLASRIAGLLKESNIPCELNGERGYDHGMFVPLKLIYPDADIPCVQLSLLHSLDPAIHIAVGKALAPLREEGVLIIGSGMSFHNMRVLMRPNGGNPESLVFDQWLQQVLCADTLSTKEREQKLIAWTEAPHARFCHPREEHLLPLHVCFGAAAGQDKPAELAFSDYLMGAKTSGFLWQ